MLFGSISYSTSWSTGRGSHALMRTSARIVTLSTSWWDLWHVPVQSVAESYSDIFSDLASVASVRAITPRSPAN
jgi:hypothetical protein